MLRTLLAGALASGALLAGGGAHAQGFGVGIGAGYGGDGYGDAPRRARGFTLAGARAGVTVLGVDIDGSAKLTLGAHGWGGGRGGYAAAPGYPVAPPPFTPPPGYWMGYSAPGFACGCAPPPPPCCVYGGY